MLSDVNMKRQVRFPKVFWLTMLFIVGMALVVGGITALSLKVLVVFLAFPLLVIFFLLAIKRFEQAVLIAIFLAPLIPTSLGVKLSDSLPLITGQRVILLSLYLVFAFRSVYLKKVRFPRLSLLTWLVLVGYIISSIIASLFSTLPLQSFYRVLASLFDNVGLFAIVAFAASGHKNRQFVRRALLSLWASFSFLALLGLIDTLIGFNVLYYLPGNQGDVLVPVYRLGIRRAQGLLPNPTALGSVIGLGIVLTMLVAMWQKNPLKRKGIWLTGVISVAALIATITRTAWLVALVGIAIWLFYVRKNRIRLVLIILIMSIVLLAVGIGGTLYSLVLAGTDLTQQNEVSTLYSRIRWIDIVWININVNNIRLWFGFGPGSVEYLTTQWTFPGFPALMTSDYLIRLAEGGLLGLLSFVAILFASMWQCRRLLRSSDLWIRAVGVFFIAVFVQMALSSLTLPIFVWAQTTYLFWIFWGILVAIRLPEKAQPRRKRIIVRSTPVSS